ncbi:hypothetical protein Mgra_00007126 [Meloidogyne graminicola]|uniref:Dynactin subunit 6 n=1 Tax=Meloidogyne graminicola TaxID=189291 RepID=A0A8S9ZJF9_9BILA|nr:hypothetical protein Mgra_00007126 [Meloidogyne graminicola]
MADESSQQLIKLNTAKVEINPEAVVAAKAILRGGNIVIGPGTIIHPQAFIDAGEGKIIFGSFNVVEETATIQNLGPAGYEMKIGDENLFEIGSICYAKEIGNNNVFGIQSKVGPDVKITNGCRIGSRCELMTDEELIENISLCFEFGQRKKVESSINSLKTQAEFLKKLLPKYLEILKNKEIT